jgi:hypothetical protein
MEIVEKLINFIISLLRKENYTYYSFKLVLDLQSPYQTLENDNQFPQINQHFQFVPSVNVDEKCIA